MKKDNIYNIILMKMMIMKGMIMMMIMMIMVIIAVIQSIFKLRTPNFAWTYKEIIFTI